MKKILLLDIENLHKTEKELIQYLKQYQYVYLVYAKSPVNFSLDALVMLSPHIVNGKLKILKMPKIGKNAADFGLAFIAGQLSTQLKAKEYSFDVMSNDHSMEYVVDLLKIAQFEAKIIQDKPEALSGAKTVNSNTTPIMQKSTPQVKGKDQVLITQYCKYLAKINQNKPAKRATLLNSLKSVLKIDKAEELNRLMQLLGTLDLIKFNQNVPQYIMHNIALWAKKTNENVVQAVALTAKQATLLS